MGHFPRIHTYDPETHEATYRISTEAPYSIILTKSMFIRSDYLFSYTWYAYIYKHLIYIC